jgi:hypothetical protein
MFGHIEGVKSGQIFKDRKALYVAGIHKQLQAGIWGGQTGAVSIVLSGGYEDDIDEMDYVYYTGQGGRDAKTGKQIADQIFDAGNKGLQFPSPPSFPTLFRILWSASTLARATLSANLCLKSSRSCSCFQRLMLAKPSSMVSINKSSSLLENQPLKLRYTASNLFS